MKRIYVNFVAILLSLLSLIGQQAFADTCSKNLTGTFTAAQAVGLCSKLPATLGASQIPQTTNTYDLGSSSKTFKSAFIGSVINLSSEVVAGAGTTTSDAAALSASKIVHQITGANGTVGWKLPVVATAAVGTTMVLLNTTAGVAKIYAETGGTVNGGSVDAAFSALTGIKPIICIATAAATWICS